jgi:methionyl aminopeptidase
MLNLGSPETRTLDDKWTVVTADGSLSAHAEHTIAVTADGPEILTLTRDQKRRLKAPTAESMAA